MVRKIQAGVETADLRNVIAHRGSSRVDAVIAVSEITVDRNRTAGWNQREIGFPSPNDFSPVRQFRIVHPIGEIETEEIDFTAGRS